MAGEPVILNVYDMYWLNEYIGNIGVGIYHTGVEVHGWEYSYGGHPLSCSGIFKSEPRDADELGENFKFRESITMGTTDFTHEEIEKLVIHSGEDFSGVKYHLMNKNCNHFSSFFTKVLCGREIPKWVNRLAFMSTCVPFLERCLPKEWLTPVALQQSLDLQRQQLQRKPSGAPLPLTASTDQSTHSTSPSMLNIFDLPSRSDCPAGKSAIDAALQSPDLTNHPSTSSKVGGAYSIPSLFSTFENAEEADFTGQSTIALNGSDQSSATYTTKTPPPGQSSTESFGKVKWTEDERVARQNSVFQLNDQSTSNLSYSKPKMDRDIEEILVGFFTANGVSSILNQRSKVDAKRANQEKDKNQ